MVGDRQYVFTKGKSCLKNLVVFCDRLRALYDSMNLIIWMTNQITRRGNLYQLCVTFVRPMMQRILNKKSESYCLIIFASSVRNHPHSEHRGHEKRGYSVWICKKNNCFLSSYCSVTSVVRKLVLSLFRIIVIISQFDCQEVRSRTMS